MANREAPEVSGGVVLALPSSGGVLRYMIERKVGFDWGTPDLRIPIVVTAVIELRTKTVGS